MNMFTHDLSGIDILPRIDKELATVLKLINGIGKGITRLKGNH